MQAISSFIRANHIGMDVEWTDNNPNMSDSGDYMTRHFKCLLKRQGKRMTVYFSQGCAHEREPSVSDVLDCLASDSASIETARSFEDWASDYGYDAESRKAEKIFKVCERQAEKLKQFLGADAYSALLWETERE